MPSAHPVISRLCHRPLSGLGLAIAMLAMVLGFSSQSMAAKHVFELSIDEMEIEVAPGFKYQVFAFNRQVPGPLMHVGEGDDVTVHVTNNTSLPHTIHWHGIHMNDNWRNDGVPGITQGNIEAGDTYTYNWKADKTGSMWYHCHVNVNEHVGIRGMWGPIVVDPKEPIAIEKEVTKDVIMMLSGWQSKYASKLGDGGGPHDVTDYFSMNGRSFPLTQPLRVKKGDVVRIRFYGAGGEFHTMHSHGHDMLITHKDGLPIPAPYLVDTVLFGPGERYDVIVRMNNPGLFIFHDHVDHHVTNNGKFPGGPITVIEYDEIERDADYAWNGVDYDPNFFYSESLAKPHGMHNHDRFVGTPIAKKGRKHRRHKK